MAEEKHSDLQARLSEIENRTSRLVADRRRRIRKAAKDVSGTGSPSRKFEEAQSHLGEQIKALESRVEDLDERRRTRRSKGKRRRVRFSNIGELVRQARRLTHSEGEDDFGLDRNFCETVKPFLDFLFDRYFRVSVKGAARFVPSDGPAILVANRGGILTYDALMIVEAVRRAHPARRVRFDIDPYLGSAPGIAPILTRLGGVRAVPENAERLLEAGHAVLFFPEGFRGAAKSIRKRYQIGAMSADFAKLALNLGVPVIPVAVLGSEEAQPVIGQLPALAKLLGWPAVPLAPAGVFPLPVKFKIRFGKPVSVGKATPRSRLKARTTAIQHRVRGELEDMLRDLQAGRASIFLG
jgi:1-acyl-sn-glycerol-3-phosphate acyltransferase